MGWLKFLIVNLVNYYNKFLRAFLFAEKAPFRVFAGDAHQEEKDCKSRAATQMCTPLNLHSKVQGAIWYLTL